jgi:hypothetical protein
MKFGKVSKLSILGRLRTAAGGDVKLVISSSMLRAPRMKVASVARKGSAPGQSRAMWAMMLPCSLSTTVCS